MSDDVFSRVQSRLAGWWKLFLLRGCLVLIRPAIIISAAHYDEIFAGILAFYFIVSSLLTSGLSMAYYKEYMPDAVRNGIRKVIRKVNLHAYLTTTIIAVGTVIFDLPLWACLSFITEFYFHQIARIFLYRKLFSAWALVSILIPILFLVYYFLLSQSDEALQSIILFSVITISLGAFFLAKGASFAKTLWRQNILFGVNRKLFLQFDKLLIGWVMVPEDFWLIAVLYQVSNIGIVIFDTVVVVPNKNKIVKNEFILNDRHVLIVNSWVCVLSLIVMVTACLLRPEENFFFLLTFCLILAVRSFSLNFNNLMLEIYFWRNDLAKISRKMFEITCLVCVFSYLTSILWGANSMAITTSCLFIFCQLYMARIYENHNAVG